ncbi:MAG: LysR family transcriptional regulator [Rhodobacteraceae bacterium]|nr:LysR family transcriptional regulator [Paracoccaceae bacterium]PHR55397.1 MAG: LysR family transcriptional regulator [Robiginitomaculum sp.]
MQKPTNSFLNRGLKLTHLQLIAALARTGGVQLAANQLSIAQPAASRLAMEIERIIGQKIHRRAGKGIELTQAGHALAKRAARILHELEDAQSDISEIGLGHVGNVRIGSVTGPSIKYILPVLRKARLTMPNVSISVEVSTSDILGARLLNGDVDFVLGRLPEGHSPALFEQQPIALEPVSLIARKDHALARAATVSAEQLLEFDWVLPFKGTILFNAIERALHLRGLPPPKQCFNTSSFLLTLALVRQSNAIAPIATSVTDVFADAQEQNALRIIKSDFEVSVEVFSLLKLADRVFTPSTQAVFEMVQDITQ